MEKIILALLGASMIYAIIHLAIGIYRGVAHPEVKFHNNELSADDVNFEKVNLLK